MKHTQSETGIHKDSDGEELVTLYIPEIRLKEEYFIEDDDDREHEIYELIRESFDEVLMRKNHYGWNDEQYKIVHDAFEREAKKLDPDLDMGYLRTGIVSKYNKE